MSLIFAFGERRPEFPIPVLNERAVRAAAGVVFFFAIVSFMNTRVGWKLPISQAFMNDTMAKKKTMPAAARTARSLSTGTE